MYTHAHAHVYIHCVCVYMYVCSFSSSEPSAEDGRQTTSAHLPHQTCAESNQVPATAQGTYFSVSNEDKKDPEPTTHTFSNIKTPK